MIGGDVEVALGSTPGIKIAGRGIRRGRRVGQGHRHMDQAALAAVAGGDDFQGSSTGVSGNLAVEAA